MNEVADTVGIFDFNDVAVGANYSIWTNPFHLVAFRVGAKRPIEQDFAAGVDVFGDDFWAVCFLHRFVCFLLAHDDFIAQSLSSCDLLFAVVGFREVPLVRNYVEL